MKLKTGRHTSALKELRKNKKRNLINNAKKSLIKKLSKKFILAVENKNKDDAKTLLSDVFSAYDKAVKTNTIHINKAARKKSSLSKLILSL